jgi:hypothetical protein
MKIKLVKMGNGSRGPYVHTDTTLHAPFKCKVGDTVEVDDRTAYHLFDKNPGLWEEVKETVVTGRRKKVTTPERAT